MTTKGRQPGVDPYRKARFRELAREIVFKDRADRRDLTTREAIGPP